MSNVLITQGTQTAIKTDTVGTEMYQYVKIDIGAAGASSPFTGTFLGGTLSGGTITNLVSGTVDTIGLLNANAYGTVVTTGTNTYGTIKPPVAGSAIYVTDIVVSVGSATTLVIGNGGTNLPLLGTLSLNPNGGLVSNFRTPLYTSVGSALVYQQSVGCTMSITCQGYVK